MELTRQPMLIMYKQALTNLRNKVNRRFTPKLEGNKACRNVNEVGRGKSVGRPKSGKGKGDAKSFSSSHSKLSCTLKSHQSSTKRTREDSKMIILLDGETIEAHPLFRFEPELWGWMQEKDKQDIRNVCI